jgi:hypothetical protein
VRVGSSSRWFFLGIGKVLSRESSTVHFRSFSGKFTVAVTAIELFTMFNVSSFVWKYQW